MSSFCAGCGHSLSLEDRFCKTCGRDSSTTPSAPAVDPAVAFGLPPETSGKAIFSLICGILFFLPPIPVGAVIFGHLSLSEMRRSRGRLGGRGLAITGLVLGYIGLAFTVYLIVFTVTSTRKAMRTMARASQVSVVATAGQTSVVSAVRTLNTAEIAYAAAHPSTGYTCSLSDLTDAWGINPSLAHGRQSGYAFELKGCSAARADGPIVKYQLVAYPNVASKKGQPAYCSNQTDVIKVARNGSAQECLLKGVDLPQNEINQTLHVQQSSPR